MVFPVLQSVWSAEGNFDLVYSTSVNNPDVWADMGSPSVAREFRIAITAGTVVGDVDNNPQIHAFELTNFPVGSTFVIAGFGTGLSQGRIQGRGGGGGNGGVEDRRWFGGAGGGGAGTPAGLGGGGVVAGADAQDGTKNGGGIGGQPVAGGQPGSAPGAGGLDGSSALNIREYDVEIVDLSVWAGSGGGSGSNNQTGGAGGEPGLDGNPGPGGNPPGSSGNAVTSNGGTLTQSGASDVRGTIL